MRRAPRYAALVLIFALLSQGCGALGEPAPEVDVPARTCPTLDQRLSQTLDAIGAGEADTLAATLEAASDEALSSLLDAVVGLLQVLWIEIKDDPSAVDLEGLSAVLADLSGVLSSAIRYLAQPGEVQLQSFEALSLLIDGCPSGSLTNVLVLLLERPELLDALGTTLADPTIQSVLDAFPADSGGSSSDGFAALIRTVIRAINNPNFVFQDLLDLIDPFFDTDAPPLNALLDELRVLLAGENLATLRVLTQCLEDQVILSDGTPGSLAIGALLYGLITEAGLTEALSQLGPAIALLQQPSTQRLLNAIIGFLAEDDEARDNLKPLVLFLLRPENAPGALADVADLIDAGLLPELIAVVGDLFVGCQPEDTSP